MKKVKDRDYKADYENYWKNIVENPDGSINKEQVMKELSDFSMLIDHISRLYVMLSGGKISYPTTLPEEVYGTYEEELEKRYQDGYADGFNDGADNGKHFPKRNAFE